MERRDGLPLRRSARLSSKRLRATADENASAMGNRMPGRKRAKRPDAAKTNAVSPREFGVPVTDGAASPAPRAAPLGDASATANGGVGTSAAAAAAVGASVPDVVAREVIPEATPGAPLSPTTSTSAVAPSAPAGPSAPGGAPPRGAGTLFSAKPIAPLAKAATETDIYLRDERNVQGQAEVVVVEQVVPTSAELRGESGDAGGDAGGGASSSASSSSEGSGGFALPAAAAARAALLEQMRTHINSEEWDVQHDAIVLARRFVVYAPAELAPELERTVLPALCGAVGNLRSATVRNAALALREIFEASDAALLGALVGFEGEAGAAQQSAGGCVAEAVRALLQRVVNADKKFIARFAKDALLATVGAKGPAAGASDALRPATVRAVLGEALRQGTGARAQASGMAAECAILVETCLGALGVGREAGAGVAVCGSVTTNGVDVAVLLRGLASMVSGKVVGEGRAAAKKALRRLRKAVGGAVDGPFEQAVDAACDAVVAALVKRESVGGPTKRGGAQLKSQSERGAGAKALSVRERFAASQKSLRTPARAQAPRTSVTTPGGVMLVM